MSAPFHPQTRPNAPTIPQDLATRAYVDSQTHNNFMIFGSTGITNNTTFRGNFNFVTGIIQSWTNSESGREYHVAVAGTWSLLTVFVRTNTFDDVTVWVSRINSADGNQGFTVAASTAGTFQDITNSDVITALQDIDIGADSSASAAGASVVNSMSSRYAF